MESDTKKWLYDVAVSQKGVNNSVNRHLQPTSRDLYEFDNMYTINKKKIKLPNESVISCYGCGKKVKTLHSNYVYSCIKCGKKFEKYRYYYTSQANKTAIVTGARTKLGHQICLKLLRSGAFVYGTTRFPEKALLIFQSYPDYSIWKDRLVLYPLDFDTKEQQQVISKFVGELKEKTIDILINCAAQTIRCREKNTNNSSFLEENRYGDAKYVDSKNVNSWNMCLGDYTQIEMEELFRVNAIAPVLMTQYLLPLLSKSTRPFVINVHAKEGLFEIHKTGKHIHSNMAKSALHMFTRCVSGNYPHINIHGCDPGWFSIDEYELEGSPWIVPPLDEIDGAARVLYPLWKNFNTKEKTRRHFDMLSY